MTFYAEMNHLYDDLNNSKKDTFPNIAFAFVIKKSGIN